MRNSGNYCEDSLFAFFYVNSTPLSFSLYFSRFMSDIHQKIVQKSGKLWTLLIFWELLGSVLLYMKICSRERERERKKREQNSSNNNKDTNFLPSFGDMVRERTGRLTVKHCSLSTLSIGALPAADWFCDVPVLEVSLAISCWNCCRCFWSKAWWSEEDAFLLMGDSGSNWASAKSALLERVFTADPESVLSPPDFELPWNKKPNKTSSHECVQRIIPKSF